LRMNVWVWVETIPFLLWNPLRTRAIPERFCSGDSLRRGAISSVCTFTFTFKLETRDMVRQLETVSHHRNLTSRYKKIIGGDQSIITKPGWQLSNHGLYGSTSRCISNWPK